MIFFYWYFIYLFYREFVVKILRFFLVCYNFYIQFVEVLDFKDQIMKLVSDIRVDVFIFNDVFNKYEI